MTDQLTLQRDEPSATAMKTLAARYAQAWNDHDIAAIMALHANDTSYQLDGAPEIQRGKSAVASKFASQLAAVPDLRFELTSLHCGPEHFVFEARITGTRANGSPLALNGIDLITVRDGLVMSKHSYMLPVR